LGLTPNVEATPAAWNSFPMDKAEIARRQLGTALSLYLDDRDPVSVHVLACAGMELAEHLALKAGAKAFRLFGQEGAPFLTDKEYGDIRGQFASAFKHATKRKGIERDDTQIMADFSDIQNDDRLFIGWFDYVNAGNSHPIESHGFQSWYMAMHPERLQSPEGRALLGELDPIFSGVARLPRDRQKAMLKKQIAKAKKNPADDE
jgi:hypothetical protein